MPEKRYSIAEANALLPYLAPTLIELRHKADEAARINRVIERASSGNGGSPEHERWARVLARTKELIERLGEWEIELRDLESGLVDFPTVIEDSDAYLCWRLGEPEVAHWHRRDEGFRGRRPL